MTASNYTSNVRLPQFGDDDSPTWRGDVNEAFREIDTAFEGVASEFAKVRKEMGDYGTPKHFKAPSFDSDSRPVYKVADAGSLIYDRDLKRLILWNGSAYTNIDGSNL